MTTDSADSLGPGDIFAGDYRIIRPLKGGGMGAVYVVEQLSTGAQRALKLMHAKLADNPEMRRRFETEARVGARIDSEHIVDVIAAGVDAKTGIPWLLMELLQGEDLEAYLRRVGPLEIGEIRTIFEQLCHAVGAAHRAGVVHRDLKPENIFLAELSKVGAAYEVKVLDFGIAKISAEAFTSNTAAMGSPSWMAPEQTEIGHPIEAGTDVWALGLIAFRMLTGKIFWRSLNVKGGTSDALLRETVLDEIPSASCRATDYGMGDRIPAGFDAWFAQCVVRNFDHRFIDASAAWSELANVLESGGAPVVLAKTAAFQKRPSSIPPPGEGDIAGAAPGRSGPREPSRPKTIPGAVTTAPATPIAKSEKASSKMVAVVVLAAGFAALVMFGALYLRHRAREREAMAAGADASAASLAHSAMGAADAAEPEGGAAVASVGSGVDLRDEVVLVRVPGGKFSMGAKDGEDDERPVHPVTLQPFEIDNTEVVVARYRACVQAGRCTAPGTGEGCNGTAAERDLHPVNCVDWSQASTYCKAHGKRLPTEEEWEYAARGDQNRKYPWGGATPAAQPCWNGEGNAAGKGKRESTCVAGSVIGDKSPFGVLDMAGNVSEWTASHYCPYPIANCPNPQRSVRGATWADFSAASLRATYRTRSLPGERSGTVGFRCARTP